MKLDLLRYYSAADYTLGLLFIDGRFECYTIEDQAQNRKVYSETRIPEGRYKVALRTVGGFHSRYSKRFPDMHKGMLELQNVPNFKYILIHIGNDDDDTAGCLLVGNSALKRGFIGHSTDAYKKFYPVVLKAIKAGKQVNIEITDFDIEPRQAPAIDPAKVDIPAVSNRVEPQKIVRAKESERSIAEIAIPNTNRSWIKRQWSAFKRTITAQNKTGKRVGRWKDALLGFVPYGRKINRFTDLFTKIINPKKKKDKRYELGNRTTF